MAAESDATEKKSSPKKEFQLNEPLNDEPRARRRSGLDRASQKKTALSLTQSFTNFMVAAPADEVDEFSEELEKSISSLSGTLQESFKVCSAPVQRRPSAEVYSVARRPSRAGSELALNMKTQVAQALLELGELDDDSDDEIAGLGTGVVVVNQEKEQLE